MKLTTSRGGSECPVTPAGRVVLLLSEASAMVTGHVLDVDGGHEI